MFNKIFIKLMQEKNVTPYKLAKELNIPKSLVYDWKNGVRTPNAENLVKLSSYFNVSVSYLLGEPDRSAEDEADQDLLVLLRAAKNLSKKDHDELVENFKRSIELYLRAKGEK